MEFYLRWLEKYEKVEGENSLENIYEQKQAYCKNGEPRKAWVCINDIPVYFNNLSESLATYIKNTNNQESEKW